MKARDKGPVSWGARRRIDCLVCCSSSIFDSADVFFHQFCAVVPKYITVNLQLHLVCRNCSTLSLSLPVLFKWINHARYLIIKTYTSAPKI